MTFHIVMTGLKENLGINVIESEMSGDPSHVASNQFFNCLS